MDTFKEKQRLDNLCAQGKLPWQVWKGNGGVSKRRTGNNKTLHPSRDRRAI